MGFKLVQKIRDLNFNDNYIRTKTLVSFYFVSFSIAVFLLLISAIVNEETKAIYIDSIQLASFIIGFIIYRITKNTILGSWIIVCLALIFEFFLLFELTKNAYGFFWYFAFPLISISVLGKYKGSLLSIFLILATVIIVRYQLFEVRVRFTPYFLTRFVTGYLVVLLLSFILEFVAQKTRRDYNNLINENRKYIQKIEKFNSQLKEAHNELMISQMDLQEANQNLDESIEYAKIIQSKLLPSKDVLTSTLKRYFLVFKPLSKVSGDFYYVNKVKKYLIFAVGDCTGHGIPGALLSVLSITLLHDIVNRDEINSSNKVLEILRERVKSTFTFFSTKDLHGLDLAFCAVHTETNIMQFSGANIPLFLIRNDELIQLKAVKNPIGYFYKEVPFKNETIELQEGDRIYLSSDGYFDQIGGEKRRKMTKRRFAETVEEVGKRGFDEQKNALLKKFYDWKGTHRQLDDVTILGFEWSFKNKE